jgi:hypothetical protein
MRRPSSTGRPSVGDKSKSGKPPHQFDAARQFLIC